MTRRERALQVRNEAIRNTYDKYRRVLPRMDAYSRTAFDFDLSDTTIRRIIRDRPPTKN